MSTAPVMTSTSDPIPLPQSLRWMQSLEFPRKLGLCERWFARSLARHGECWVRTSTGLIWHLDLRNPTHRWIVYGYYDSGLLRWAKRNVPAEGCIVDSGANIGQVALYLSQWLQGGRVFAFEPGAAAAAWLEGCMQLHSELPLELLRAGLSDHEGTAGLANASTDVFLGAQAAITTTGGESIKLVRLDQVMAARGVTEIALWKLDVEGHEILALSGAGSLLTEHRIKALYVELAGDNGRRVIEFLARLGYQPHDLSSRGHTRPFEHSAGHDNALFLPG